MMKTEQGNWVENEADVRELINSSVQNMFALDGQGSPRPRLDVAAPKLPDEFINDRGKGNLEEAVQNTLFQMHPWKALGPDGFQACFYQHFWDILKADLVSLVARVFTTGVMPSDINETLIALIPKVARPEFVRQLRPISLCNVLYKVVTKMLVNKLRPFLHDLIGPEQVSFIHGRQAADNIILAQELVHTIRKSKAKMGLMAIKIDLAKAYYRIRWDFLQDAFGFPTDWIRLLCLVCRALDYLSC